MSGPWKLFLTQRKSRFPLQKSVFRDVRMQSCLALRFLEWHFVLHYMKSLLSSQTSHRGWPACGRLGRQTSARTETSARLKITFVDMTYPKGWTGSLPLCPLIFSCSVLCVLSMFCLIWQVCHCGIPFKSYPSQMNKVLLVFFSRTLLLKTLLSHMDCSRIFPYPLRM